MIEKADIDFGWTRPLPEEAFAYGYQAEMRHFVECVRDGATPRETYEDGYIVNCVLDAGYESMRSKRWVTQLRMIFDWGNGMPVIPSENEEEYFAKQELELKRKLAKDGRRRCSPRSGRVPKPFTT